MDQIYSTTLDDGNSTGPEPHWVDQEVLASGFKDKRLGKRFKTVLKQLSEATAESIPWACQDWASTKAAYRFFDNDRVSEQEILAGHFRATRERFAGTTAKVLVLHDTTELSYRRENIGLLHKPKHGPDDRWRKENPLCGISMHSGLVVTQAGLPLGLAAVKFWTRQEFKGTNALKRTVNPTRVPIEQKESLRWLQNVRQATALLGEAQRCVHIGDRESDIYELFCAAESAATNFLIRTCANRLAQDGDTTVAAVMAEVAVQGLHCIEVRDKKGRVSEAVLELKFQRLRVLPPIGKQSRYPALELTVIHATERGKPKGRERIEWKLLTNLPVATTQDVIEKLNWYALRWKIEVFHKVLKSGCKVEASGLRTAERLVRLLATCCILAWRIFWMTMVNRAQPEAHPGIAFTQMELDVLDRLVPNGGKVSAGTLTGYITKIAKLGGYLGRANDPDPGNIVMWRGLSRLTDIVLGASLGEEIVGN
jgi:hypothetical protein